MEERPYIEVKLTNDGEVVHVGRRVIVRDKFGDAYMLDPVTGLRYSVSTGEALARGPELQSRT